MQSSPSTNAHASLCEQLPNKAMQATCEAHAPDGARSARAVSRFSANAMRAPRQRGGLMGLGMNVAQRHFRGALDFPPPIRQKKHLAPRRQGF